MAHDISVRVAELTAQRVHFVHATVVRSQEPSSARAGDQAIVHADGTIEGFVGGHCAAGSVRTAALRALEYDESMLLRILPDGTPAFPEASGASVVVNPCLSGGALEIFLEPKLPIPLFQVVGSTPIAESVAFLAEHVGFSVSQSDAAPEPEGAIAAVISIQGGDEPAAIRAALDAGVEYVGVIASARRGKLMLDEMGLTAPELARIHTPAGLPIGARTAPEIALSIMAEVVAKVRMEGLSAPTMTTDQMQDTVPAPEQVIDPVCGMTVTIGSTTPHLELDGQHYWFCCVSCRDRFDAAEG